MQTKKWITLAVAAIFFLAALGGSASAQDKAYPANRSVAKVMKITVIGEIIKDESTGGYYIQGKKPAEIFRITNQNPDILEEYVKNGKDVTIEAHSVMGDNLVIEKIQGKNYTEAVK